MQEKINLFKFEIHQYLMNKWLEILIGLIFIIAAILLWVYNIWGMGMAALEFLKGGIVWFIILIGLLLLLVGISDLRD